MPEQIQTEALVLQSNRQSSTAISFAPRDWKELREFAKEIADSDLVPKDYRGKPGNIIVAVQTGAELGIAPMQSLSGISVINGRGSVWGDLFLAIIQASPDYEWHKEWFEGSGKTRVAICQIKRKGSPTHHEVRFGFEDATRAELLGKDTYKKYPDRMYQMRARGFCGRDQFSDALKGLVIREEAEDYPVIDGGRLEAVPTSTSSAAPAAAQPPDPNEQPITMEEAKEYFVAWKASGWTVADAKEATQRIAGVTASNQIKRKFYAACMAWAKSTPGDAHEPAKEGA